MATLMIVHEVDDVDRWLASSRRDEILQCLACRHGRSSTRSGRIVSGWS